MKKHLVRFCQIAFAVTLVCYLSSCKDPAIADKNNTLGFDPINLEHLDTDEVYINTVAEAPLLASAVSTGVLGSMDDPIFGRTFASFYAQCLLSSSGVVFNNNPVADSAVLYIPFLNDSSKYGPCRQPIDIQVYEVSQYMDPTATYYQNDAFSVYSQPIGQLNNYVPDLVDSTFAWHNTQAPQIIVRLNSSFAQKLLNADSAYLSSSTDFINYMKGIYVTTNTSKVGDGISYLNLQSARISLYYHTSAADTLRFDFPISSYSTTVNHFDHQNSGKPVSTAIGAGVSTTTQLAGYIQSGAGAKLKVRIPGLSTLPANIGVTKAELILPVDISDTATYHLPANPVLYRLDDTLGTFVLNAYNLSGVGNLSTRQDNAGNNYYCYVFNVTEFVQRMQNGYYGNYGFYVQYSYTVRADRAVILNDPSQYARQCKLKITYTKLQ
ncbi:MAG: DUF4270 family protein [Bacteroidetes bacterium]|nr:DUF4270 family protein [Bacteroidota bacterium]